MPDSITISNSFAQEIKLSLDDALRCINVHETDDGFDPQKAIGGIVRVRAELVNVLAQNVVLQNGNCSTMRKELEALGSEVGRLKTRVERLLKAA